MADIRKSFELWSEKAVADPDLKAELSKMDEDAKNDAFYRDLEFGTAGLRGVIGAGTNRMPFLFLIHPAALPLSLLLW
ncbi:MAG: hypothetical protein ACI4JY_06355, partial [Oscillospiraceae bacterium]